MCDDKKHKHTKGEFKLTGKYEKNNKTTKVGETEFVKNQYEEGIAKKLKSSPETSLFYVHGRGN